MQLKDAYQGDEGILELLYHMNVVLDYSNSSLLALFKAFINHADQLKVNEYANVIQFQGFIFKFVLKNKFKLYL